MFWLLLLFCRVSVRPQGKSHLFISLVFVVVATVVAVVVVVVLVVVVLATVVVTVVVVAVVVVAVVVVVAYKSPHSPLPLSSTRNIWNIGVRNGQPA